MKSILTLAISATLLASCSFFDEEPTIGAPQVRCPAPPAVLMEPVDRPEPIQENVTPDDNTGRN